jgi:hypothetical protein
MVLKSHDGTQFKLNVTQFRSPMTSAINSAQTKTMLQHFPIRAGQPDINFTCQFRSNDEKHIFQSFVRDHQISAQTAKDELGEVILFWPERNIENWTGYIVEFHVEEVRFVYAPKVTFGVALVNSLMSERTTVASFGSFWTSIWGPQIPAYQGPGPLDVDNMIKPPTPPSSQSPNTSSGSNPAPPDVIPLTGGNR